MSDESLQARQRARLKKTFSAEERRGLRLGFWARLTALAVGGVWVLLSMETPRLFYFLGILALLAVLAMGWWLLSRGRLRAPWIKYALVTAEMAVLSWALIVPPPVGPWPWPPTIIYHGSSVTFFFVLLAASVFAYSPRLVLWAGAMAALFWALGAAWIATRPGVTALVDPSAGGTQPPKRLLDIVYDPMFINLGVRIEEVLTIFIVTGVLTVAIWRVRRVVWRQARAERARADLARYFSPGQVDALTVSDEPLREIRTQTVAVLFADMVGFTGISEKMDPPDVIELLREFHRRMEQAVFDNGGTLEKFIGDEVMATFGTPRPDPSDTTNALKCAVAIRETMAQWNERREAAGRQLLRVGVGIHYGPVVIGDIGGDRRLEFAVLGDTVNVASRLEQLTRKLGVTIVASDEVVSRARQQSGEVACEGLVQADSPLSLRGRRQAVPIWIDRPFEPVAESGAAS